jgi:hypothetical protein
MTTDTTTLEAIRDKAITLIQALTPLKAAHIPFRRHVAEGDFVAWAEANPSACCRRFQILRTGAGEPAMVSNTDLEDRRERLLLVIAYPKTYGLYGEENIRDADDVMESDRELIDGRSGIGKNNAGGYVAGQHSSLLLEANTEEGEAVRFAQLLFEVTYYREIPS